MKKIALVAVLLSGLVGGLFAATVKDVNWYNPRKASFDINVGWVGGGFGALADFDFTLGSFNLGFGPINYKIGALADIAFPIYSGINFAVGPMFTIDWALGSVMTANTFFDKLSFYWGIGVGFFYDSALSQISSYYRALGYSAYSPICFMTKAGVKYHFSDTMSLVLQEADAWYWNSTIGIEFKF